MRRVYPRTTQRFWPDENPSGRRLRQLVGSPPFTESEVEVIGVVANAKYRTVGETRIPFAYFPLLQATSDEVTILVKHDRDPLAPLPAVREDNDLRGSGDTIVVQDF